MASPEHGELHEMLRTAIFYFILTSTQTQNLTCLLSKTHQTLTAFLTMKDDDSQKLVADIKDRAHRDLSIHVSQHFLFLFLVSQKLTQSSCHILLYLTRQTSEQFFIMKYAFDTISDGFMSFSIKNYA